jgi:hypothetical protein
MAHSPLPTELCSKLDCFAVRRMTSCAMTQRTKSKKAAAQATLASVTKEMARPRFAESAREEEDEARRSVAKHESSIPVHVGAPEAEK